MVQNDHSETVEVQGALHQRGENEFDAFETRPVDFWTVMACVVCCAKAFDPFLVLCSLVACLLVWHTASGSRIHLRSMPLLVCPPGRNLVDH